MFDSLHKKNVGFNIWYFEKLFSLEDLNLLENQVKNFEFCLISGQRTDRTDRIWMHQYPAFLKICRFFDSDETKQYFSNITNFQYKNCRTRIELCLDKKNSWLHSHVDDTAKKFTLQVYLTNSENSTVFNETEFVAKANCGWFFNNTGNEYHNLLPLKNDRISIIVNYVNENWIDESVLV